MDEFIHPIDEFDDYLNEMFDFGDFTNGDERVQTSSWSEESSRMSEDTASKHKLLTSSEDKDDAVTITPSDLEGLQPGRHLSDNIIDVYIRYLEGVLPLEDRERFYFFNSLFFRKLLGNSSETEDIDQCEVDYNQVRKWTGAANLFEKDYVFIPVLRRSHWSLIIICHLSSLTSTPDKRKGSPYIIHLDPVEEQHESFEGQVRRYLFQACMESYQTSNEKDSMLEALAFNMKYVRAQVPRQVGSCDCGVYVLLYVEDFLRKSISGFRLATNEGVLHFSTTEFAGEISVKRLIIHNLIIGLSGNRQVRAARPSLLNSRALAQSKRLLKPLMERNKKWNERETSVLLKLLEENGRIQKRNGGPTHWELISQNIETKSVDECRNRYDVLLKAYKKIKGTGKPFYEITENERRQLKLTTPLNEEWYEAIDRICNAKSGKRAKLSTDSSPSFSHNSPIWPERPKPEKPSRNQAIPGFSNLGGDSRSTLLNLVQALSLEDWVPRNYEGFKDPRIIELEAVSQWLAIVQDRKLLYIRKVMLELLKLKLVTIRIVMDYTLDEEVPYLELSNARMYKKFVDKVLRKNPNFVISLQTCEDYDSVSFPKAPEPSVLQRIRVLNLYRCHKLEHADLSYFPELRSLAIGFCYNLRVVSGWGVVKELGWLEIRVCPSYELIPVPDFTECVRLRRLKSSGIESRPLNSIDLSSLTSLEVLSLWSCGTLTTIQGLRRLHFLTRLDLGGCEVLRGVPELGCLKALTHLDLCKSGVEEIAGVQELHLLATLDLIGCKSLKTLPWLGHLKELIHLLITGSGVEEIPGVQDLISLEKLLCMGSRLNRLPDLHHLPRLLHVVIHETPLSTADPSSFYYGKSILRFNEERMHFDDNISGISDSSDISDRD